MMRAYVAYDERGELKFSGECAEAEVEPLSQSLTDGLSLLVIDGSANGNDHYVDVSGDEPVLRERVDLPASCAGGMLLGLPAECVVLVEGPVLARIEGVQAGDHELIFDAPGDYKLRIECVDSRYRPVELMVSI